ncbi:G-type lectin S-receptor-like Serine/Threonine-kinase [Rhynchospora pubera]|uniref:Receptor-like serine/threonine-protein kinase n=1 Tax=Rhynchospora pubera TaxID=906938 RepID=A0AAV8CSM8_9POAL|nr:G-type lectin S-receptor-like Serine/Threonine-kinase [Rhynchospora pubera]
MKTKLPKQFIIALFILAYSPVTWSTNTNTLFPNQNITEGQSLISSNGIFELGFFRPDSTTDSFLGIWFRVSSDTIVWVANRDNPLKNTSGILNIHNNGSLALYDSSGRMVWSSSSNATSITNDFSPFLQLNDLGNLILKNQGSNNTIIWQSFDYPTNSLLAGMKLGKNLKTGFETVLSSWKSSSDPAEGKYKYKMDTEGAPEIILWDRDQIRFRTGMWNGLYFSETTQMLSYRDMFTFLFIWNQDEVSYGFEAKSSSTLSRVYLNEAGIMQRLVWDQDQQTWNEFWAGPKDECDYYAKCGAFSICQPNSVTACNCIRGFEPETPTEWYMRDYSGWCKRRTPLGCTANSDGFYVLKGVKLPDSHNATVAANISVEECRIRCLKNCSCLAYAPSNITGKGSGCVMWNISLVDIKHVNGGLDNLHVKVFKSELGTTNKKRLAIIAGTISSAVFVLLICFVGRLLWRKKKNSKQGKLIASSNLITVISVLHNSYRKSHFASATKEKTLEENDSIKDADLPVFDMDTIAQATDNFSITNVVGQGGFGIVYKGKLPYGQEIAVKRLSGNSSQGLKEFVNEVTLIAKLQHRNLVRLLGCCIHDNERMLIYEFLTNKSLNFFIFDAEKRTTLSWRTRLDIVTGIARGLLYLHHDSRFNIIHRDLKAANVLLDEDMNPKISDFGTARLFEREHAVLCTETVIGTRGYMSPEYVQEGKFSVKSDVYSFGVLLLEIMSGQRNQGNQNLVTDAWKLWEEQSILKLLDEAVESTVVASELSRFIHVGLLCVQECPDDRPSMSSVVMMLSSDNLVLPTPRKSSASRSIGGFTADHHFYDSDIISVDQLTITGTEGR